jgi:hypothetical protein
MSNIYNVGRTLSFAEQCGVIPHGIFLLAYGAQVNDHYLQGDPPSVDTLKAAVAAGRETAAMPNACEFLKGNTEVVRFIQSFALMSIQNQPGIQH